MNALDLGERFAHFAQRPGHLFGVAARVELGFLQEAHPAGQTLQHLFAAGLEFGAPPPRFLQRHPLPLQLFLRAFEFHQPLLGFRDAGVKLLARGRTTRSAGGGGGKRRLLPGMKIAIHKICLIKS